MLSTSVFLPSHIEGGSQNDSSKEVACRAGRDQLEAQMSARIMTLTKSFGTYLS